MNLSRKGNFAIMAILLIIAAGSISAQTPQPTSKAISEEDFQKLNKKLELFQLERDIWKEKYESLYERYRSVLLKQLVRELEEEVSELRGLPLHHHVKYKAIKPDEVRRYIEREIDEIYPASQLEYYSRLFRLLGFVEEDIDLKKMILDLYVEQAGGFYDDSTHTLYIVEHFDLEKSLTRLILAHEICHALQDQNFSFNDLPLRVQNNDDLQLAIMCIIEGDAMLFTAEYMTRLSPLSILLDMPSLLALDQSQFSSTPYFVQQTLLFPYIQGAAFVDQAITLQGKEARSNLFRDFPRSSEQILHPEKYFFSRDDPTTVTLADISRSLGEDWRKVLENVMGEFSIRLLFETHLDPERAVKASTGWEGDSFHLYVNDAEGYVFLWQSIWETDEDAQEFFDSIKALLPLAHGAATFYDRTDSRVSLRFLNKPDWATVSQKKGQVTLLLSSFEPTRELQEIISDAASRSENR
jgi:hypothetical protein